MKSKYLLIVLFGLAVSLKAQTEDPYQYFPANIGDRWEYTQAGPDIIYTVIRDSIDQKDSSRFIFYNPPSNYGARYRIDRHYNVFGDPKSGNWFRYKLDAKVGESWIAVAKIWAEKIIDISQAYVFGKLTTVKTIGYYRLTNGDTVLTENSILQYWQKLAYGFGLISQENGAEQPTLLRGCRINGIVYGTVDVKENLNELPSDFKLYQNYPNPFNPTSTIRFALKNGGKVSLKVYDVLGKEVANLAEGYYEAGKHVAPFDGSDLASGIYFYRLVTPNATITKKMVLTK